MPTCSNCGRERAETIEQTLWTARETTHVTPYNGSIERQTTTRYEDWKEHHFKVCRPCLQRARIRPLAGIGIYLVLMFLLLLLVGFLRASNTIDYAIIIAGGAITFTLSILATRKMNIPRLALVERRMQDSSGRYKVFSIRQYRERTHQPGV